MAELNRLLSHNCFTECGGAEDVTWYSNGVHDLFLYDDGRWLIVDAEAPDALVSQGRGIDELAAKVVHPRWIDARGFIVREGQS